MNKGVAIQGVSGLSKKFPFVKLQYSHVAVERVVGLTVNLYFYLDF